VLRPWDFTVSQTPNLATFIKELTLKLPEDRDVNFRAVVMFSLTAPCATSATTKGP